MPALLFLSSNRRELRLATQAWKEGSAEYRPTLGARLGAMREFCVPIFMAVFGSIAMVAGVTTAIVSDLTPTKA